VDDEWLIAQCLLGKTAYWNVLIRRYQDRLFEKVSLLVENSQDAWEIVELTFLSAKTALSSFKHYPASLTSYLHYMNVKVQSPFFMWLLNSLWSHP
jgi:DNA-directed RNA polymerase specialized sigma24 family protein